ncbi:helix-turn-helix domain-containing protein [Puia sp.]|jgi:excisionase family DNA binding protein|uniref:helix-turn-helix domain-containing protein n=1 Tax=Puia sp. TaxID=2045100 RepID=UPI002F3EB3E4
MKVEIVTKEDLDNFRQILLADLTKVIKRPDPAQPWLKSYEVRKLLKISAGTLHRLRAKGILPFSRVGGTFLYKNEDVQKLVELNIEKR